jgi:hypothetical protein
MKLSRRRFLAGTGAALAGTGLLSAVERTAASNPKRIIYYNNFASHLLCAYNPNMYYPSLPFRWSDDDWRGVIDMTAHFGFNVFEFWLEPRMFCREGLESDVGREYTRQMNVAIEHARRRGMKAEALVALATVGEKWRTLCPNVPAEWSECLYLWDLWMRRLPGLEVVGIFPGDPGACSRNGCTAETYIDKSVEVASLVKKNLPNAEIELGTWGPPFFGWGNINMPPQSKGEFIPADQGSAWAFSKKRADRSMQYLLKRLRDFPPDTLVSLNLGFNPDGNPAGEQDARPWAREIAKSNRILTWDFSLTEGENAVFPHYRFSRLYARRREESAAAPYCGGICYTMTPLLNQLSLYQAAHSFNHPDADSKAVADRFFTMLFGPSGAQVTENYRLFEVIPDWGCYDVVKMSKTEYHARMVQLVECLEDLKSSVDAGAVFYPSPETYCKELLFFARVFADLTSPKPDFAAVKKRYWDHVYRIYDSLTDHVDPRPRGATDRFIQHFVNWKET